MYRFLRLICAIGGVALATSQACAKPAIFLPTGDKDAELTKVADGPAKEKGVRLGEQVASDLLAIRANDGSNVASIDCACIDPVVSYTRRRSGSLSVS